MCGEVREVTVGEGLCECILKLELYEFDDLC